jgi:hypothetical protein
MSTPYADAAPDYYKAGWAPLPLPPGEKNPPPKGWTGAAAPYPSFPDVYTWAEDHPGGNIGLRMPVDVVGIDVDDYAKHGIQKLGAASLAELEEKFGQLPPTYSSTARGWGVSRIRFYRVPEGLSWPGQAGPDIEVIQKRHRFAAVWPSTNPDADGAEYAWYDLDGETCPIPNVADLTDMPDEWVMGLTGGEAEKDIPRAPQASPERRIWMAAPEHTGDACARLWRGVQQGCVELVGSQPGGRHDIARDATVSIAYLAAEGHPGLAAGLRALQSAFEASTQGEDRSGEWSRLVNGALSIAASRGITPLGDPCTDPLRAEGPELIRLAASPSGSFPSAPLGVPPLSGAPGETPMLPEDVRRLLVEQEAERIRLRRDAQRLVAGEGRAVPGVALSLGDLLAQPRQAVRYRIEGLLPTGGRAVLAAQRKAGKTTMMTNLVRQLADGGMFLEAFQVNRPAGRIGLLDFEMTQQQLVEWLDDAKIVNDENVWVMLERGRASAFDILDDHIRADWAERLRALNTSVLIVDCLRPILDSLGLDESHESGRFLVALDALANEAGIGEMVLVHHAGHNGERSRGDSRLRDWPDAEWRIMRDKVPEGEEPPPDCARFFAAEGRGVSVFERRLTFDPGSRRLSLGEGSRSDVKAERQKTNFEGRVMEVLASAAEPMSKGAIRQATGSTTAQNGLAVDALLARGLIRQAGFGKTGYVLFSIASRQAVRDDTPEL